MKTLVLNCGSSSIKYKLFEMTTGEIIAQGRVEKLGLSGSLIKNANAQGEEVTIEQDIYGHEDGISLILKMLTDETQGCISDYKEIDALGHRVGQGGEKFASSLLISPDEILIVI